MDIIAFIRCEVLIRLFGVSLAELANFDVPEELLHQFDIVCDTLTKADKPHSKRPVVGAQLKPPTCTFDPIFSGAIEACCQHWTLMFFVPGISWADVDDDEIPNSSPLWKQYGMKTTPTKEKS